MFYRKKSNPSIFGIEVNEYFIKFDRGVYLFLVNTLDRPEQTKIKREGERGRVIEENEKMAK